MGLVGDRRVRRDAALIAAARKLMHMVGWTANDVDLAEIDEASAACAIAWRDQCGLDPAQVNVHGGDIDFGRSA